jgi:hypothetical protein
MPEELLDQLEEETLLEVEEPTPEPPKFSGLLQNIFPDGTIEYDGQIGLPDDFPLTDAERAEVENPGTPAPPTPPTPDYQAFWEGLMTSSLYTAIREQSMVSLPVNTLGTEFIALLGDAKAGRPYEAAIQQSMAAILQTGSFTPEQLVELQAVLVAANLDSIYTLS